MAEVKVNDKVTANCIERTWVDAYGSRYAFLGKNRDDDILAEYTVRSLDTGETLNGSSASGYPVALEVFKALCPGIAE
jgi:hypothetical protein